MILGEVFRSYVHDAQRKRRDIGAHSSAAGPVAGLSGASQEDCNGLAECRDDEVGRVTRWMSEKAFRVHPFTVHPCEKRKTYGICTAW